MENINNLQNQVAEIKANDKLTTDEKVEQIHNAVQSLSDNWRVDRSSDKAQDLASILSSARVMAQSLIPNVEVTFAGIKTARTDRKTIQLSAKYTKGPAPLPGDQVDIMLGLTVHEMGHVLFSEDKTQFVQEMQDTCNVVLNSDRKPFGTLIDIFEDMYVNHIMSGFPGYKEYLMCDINAAVGTVNMDAITATLKGKCSRMDMLNCIAALGIFGIPLPNDISQENLGVLQNILTLATLMSIKKIPKQQALRESWSVLRRLPDVVDHENDGLFKPPEPPKPEENTEEPEKPEEEPDEGMSGGNDEHNDNQTEDGGAPQDSDTGDNPEPKEHDDNPDSAGDSLDKDDSGSDVDNADNNAPSESGDNSTENPDEGVESDQQRDNEAGQSGESQEELNDQSNSQEKSNELGEPSEGGEPSETESDGDGSDGSGDREVEAKGSGTETDGDSGDGQSEQSDIEPEPVDDRPSIEDYQQSKDFASKLDDDITNHEQLDKELADKVQQAVISKSSDLSELIGNLAKDSPSQIIPFIPEEDGDKTTISRQAAYETEEKTRRVFQEYRLKRTRDYRGLEDGRISSRRLYRAGYGDFRVFQRRERPDEINMCVFLLMDLSGSVHCYEELIDQIVVALSDALTKEKVEFIALGYSHRNGKVHIARLYDKELGKPRLKLDRQVWGGTPSYEGLAAAIAQLMRLSPTKEKILFHFTDGQPNSGQVVHIGKLISDARRNGIKDIHINLQGRYGILGTSAEAFQLLYGDSARNIESIEDLPGIIQDELRRKLQI